MRSVRIPDQADSKWLLKIGFTASNDATMLGVLKFIGFVGAGGRPTETWQAYYRGEGKAVLARAIKGSYESLFRHFPSPWSLGTKELRDFFRAETGASQARISKMADTFRNLCDLADFETESRSAIPIMISGGELKVGQDADDPAPSRDMKVTININLPETENEEVYRKIFKILSEYLLR